MRIVAGTALSIGVLGLVPTATGTHLAGSIALGAPRILYSSDWSGTSEIYSVDPSGRTPTALITSGARPNPSPDGRHLLYWRGYRLLVARADGSGQRLIHAFATAVQYYPSGDPAWAPDSRRFAFAREDVIHVADADGLHDRSVAPGWAPAWSPDGRSLTFNTARGIAVVGQRGMKLITRSPVGSDDRSSSGTAWSPTGKWIAYTTGSYTVALVSPDGRVHRSLAHGTFPVWSPNGRMLAFDGRGDVEVVDIASGKVLHVAANVFEGWSPDGRTLAVEVFNNTSSNPIDLVDAKTGAVRTRLSANGGYVYWSPGGRKFAYAAVAEDSGHLDTGFDFRVGSLTGSTVTVVAAAGDYGGLIDRPQFSPPGWAWTRPPAGMRFRPAPPRRIANVSADQLTAPWAITRLAADGDKIAYVSCGHVFVWTPASGAVVQEEPVASMSPACSTPGNYVAYNVYDLALAGDRVASGQVCCNSAKNWELRERSLATPARSYTLGAGPGEEPGSGNVGYPVGSGSLLVFSTWQWKYASDGHLLTVQQTILRAGPTGCGDCPALRTDPGPLILDDIDANRIAAHGDNAVVVLDAGGAQLLSLPVKAVGHGSCRPRSGRARAGRAARLRR
jgi:Tol biopolymer transport system component